MFSDEDDEGGWATHREADDLWDSLDDGEPEDEGGWATHREADDLWDSLDDGEPEPEPEHRCPRCGAPCVCEGQSICEPDQCGHFCESEPQYPR